MQHLRFFLPHFSLYIQPAGEGCNLERIEVFLGRSIMASEYVLPEKYTEDLKDENGNPMSKR